MTGYGLLALTLADRLGEAFQAVRWLLERRPRPGWDGFQRLKQIGLLDPFKVGPPVDS